MFPEASLIPVTLSGNTTFQVAAPPSDPVAQYLRVTGRLPDDCPVGLARALVRPGEVVLDIGSHIGCFSLALAASGCQVFALEASPINARLLAAGVQASGLADRVQVINAAASHRHGTLSFRANGPCGHVCAAGTEGSIEVPAAPVPALLERVGVSRVDLIKMDIEGSEVDALEGMTSWLKAIGLPPLICESNHFAQQLRGRSARRLRECLWGLGYAHLYRVSAADQRLLRVGKDDFHGEMFIDYLATARPVSGLAGWRVTRQPSISAEAVALLEGSRGCYSEPGYLATYGKALAEASPRLLRHPGIRVMLDQLRRHPSPAVRGTVSGLRYRPSGLSGWLWQQRIRLAQVPSHFLESPLRVVRKVARLTRKTFPGRTTR